MRRAFLTSLCLFHAAGSAAVADQVVIAGRSRPGVKIVAFNRGLLQFRTADGALEQAWISEIDFLNVELGGPFADFNEAERYLAKGQAEAALVRYRRAQKTTEDFWPDFIEARMLRACDRPSLIDQAAASMVRMVRAQHSGPPSAARLIPAAIPQQRDAKVVQALDTLDSALAKNPGEDQRLPLEWFRYELLRRTGDARVSQNARTVALWDVPASMRCERVYAIQLEALIATTSGVVGADELKALDTFVRHCPDTLLPTALVLKGQTLLREAKSREDVIRAGWPFLRVVIHMPDDAFAADGLLGTAQVYERLEQNDKAVRLLEESLEHKKITDEARKKAETALARLRPVGNTK